MAVKFTQPEINIREKITELDRPVGVAGNELLKAETVEQQQAHLGLGRKNIIINGNFDIWQRGNTISGTGYYYACDRFQGYGYGTNTSTISKQEFNYGEFPSEVPADYYMRVTSTQSHPYFRHTIEHPKRYSGKTMTYTLWARSDTNVSLNPGIVIFHSGGYLYASEVNRTTNRKDFWWDLTSEWKKYKVTFKMPDLSAYTFTENNYFAVEHAATTGITGSIDIAQVQLELGEQSTPFEYRSVGEELALCQRYYQRYANTIASGDNVITRGNETVYSSAYVQNHFDFVAPMRSPPAFSYSDVAVFKSYSGSSEGISTAISATMLWEYGARINITTSGQVQGNACKSYIQNGKWIAFEAEL